MQAEVRRVGNPAAEATSDGARPSMDGRTGAAPRGLRAPCRISGVRVERAALPRRRRLHYRFTVAVPAETAHFGDKPPRAWSRRRGCPRAAGAAGVRGGHRRCGVTAVVVCPCACPPRPSLRPKPGVERAEATPSTTAAEEATSATASTTSSTTLPEPQRPPPWRPRRRGRRARAPPGKRRARRARPSDR